MGKRLFLAATLTSLLASAGCLRNMCERHGYYPVQPSACCVPCCPPCAPAAAGYATTAAPPAWNAPAAVPASGGACCCVPAVPPPPPH